MKKFGKGDLNTQLNCNKNTYSKSIYCVFILYYEDFHRKFSCNGRK